VSCDPERITAFVDGALDPVRARLTEEHLAACADCRAQAEAERALKARLRSLSAPEPRAAAEQTLRRRLRPAWKRRLRWAVPLAAGLAAMVVWVRGAAPFVAWELARDHDHCFGMEALPAQLWSGDPDRVGSWLEEHGRPLPPVPEEAHGLELVGVRRCPLLDRRVGHVYYASAERSGGRNLSLFVVPGRVRLQDGLRTRSGGKTVRLLRTGDALVGLVSEDEEAVEAFARALSTRMAALDR
jgi:anti-sigma factor RsiW